LLETYSLRKLFNGIASAKCIVVPLISNVIFFYVC
jgi:hypothetical protein